MQGIDSGKWRTYNEVELTMKTRKEQGPQIADGVKGYSWPTP